MFDAKFDELEPHDRQRVGGKVCSYCACAGWPACDSQLQPALCWAVGAGHGQAVHLPRSCLAPLKH